ncbi:MAG: hypothetical protein E7073_06785 [Bacteroidales bacterium]|jgi:hypothetical protein|nr:hypothetical protein [Bacteroidales bacterium]
MRAPKDIAAALGQYAHDNGIEADEADVAEASDLNYKMQLALYDKARKHVVGHKEVPLLNELHLRTE